MLTATEPVGYSRKFYTRRLNPEIQPLTLLYTNFDRKGASFVYPLLINGTRFTYLVSNFAFLTARKVNALSLKYEYVTKPERFLDFFTAKKCIC